LFWLQVLRYNGEQKSSDLDRHDDMNSADYYRLLGLTEEASHKDIRAARGRLMLRWHPDTIAHNSELHSVDTEQEKQTIANERSKQINNAADFLLSQPDFLRSKTAEKRQDNKTSNSESNTDESDAYARRRKQERATQQEKVERARKEAEDRQRQEEVLRQQQQDAEEAKQQRQAAEDRQRQEEQRQRKAAQEEGRQAHRKAEAAEKAQREAEAAQRVEQYKQRQAAKMKRFFRAWWSFFFIVMSIFLYSATRPVPQQVYNTTQATAPVDSSTTNSQKIESGELSTTKAKGGGGRGWQEISEIWSQTDNGGVWIGSSRIQVEDTFEQPSLKFSRPDGLSEEMWFTPGSKGYISIVLQNDEVAQVESVISTPGGDLLPGAKSIHLGEVKKDHPNLQVSAYGYGLSKYAGVDGHDAENAYDEETKHFQGDAVTYYYDDVKSGITFAFGVQDYFDKNIQIEKIIVHKPGIPVFPASNGKSQPPVDEVPDATHPPSS
jgi:curved DNA-binding protein CbpA